MSDLSRIEAWQDEPCPHDEQRKFCCAECLLDLVASERAAATAACAAHVEEHISRAVGRAWIAEEIRALSPEGWVGVRREDLTELHESLAELHALVVGECPRLLDEDSGGDAGLDIRIRAALARGKGE